MRERAVTVGLPEHVSRMLLEVAQQQANHHVLLRRLTLRDVAGDRRPGGDDRGQDHADGIRGHQGKRVVQRWFARQEDRGGRASTEHTHVRDARHRNRREDDGATAQHARGEHRENEALRRGRRRKPQHGKRSPNEGENRRVQDGAPNRSRRCSVLRHLAVLPPSYAAEKRDDGKRHCPHGERRAVDGWV